MREGKAEGFHAIRWPVLAVLASLSACKLPTFAVSVALQGSSGAGQVSASTPDPCELDLDFGSVSVGQQATATVAISNHSSLAITLLPFSPDLDPEFDLSISTEVPRSIPAGATLELTMGFEVYRAGSASSTFAIPVGSPPGVCGGAFTVQLTGNGIDYRLVLSPPLLEFGPAVVNTVESQTATLTNRSSMPLDGITAVLGGSNPGQFALNSVPSWLDAGESVPIDVTFTPLSVGAPSSASVFFGSPSGAGASLTMVGRQVASSLVLMPSVIDFGYVIPPATAMACTTLSNQANATVTVSGITDFVDAEGAFAMSPINAANPPNAVGLPVTLASGSSARVCFSFSPQKGQRYLGQATLVTDDPGGSNPVVSLNGWGQGPEIDCTPASLAFGSVLDRAASVLSVTCANLGTPLPGTTLMISPTIAGSAVFSARFDLGSDPDPLAGLGPGESARIDVEYKPVGSASDQATLILNNNGGQGAPIRIPLTGQALDLAPCQFGISPAKLDFGNVAQGDSSIPLAFVVENLGADACIVSGLTIGNDLPGNFHVLSTSIQPASDGTITIPGVASLTVNFQFAPMLGGDFSAEARFSITNPSEPNQIVPLSGSSASTCLVMTPPNLNFGDVGVDDAGVLCTSAGRSFTVYNDCATPATLQGFTLQSGPGDSVAQFSTPAGPQIPATIAPGSSVAFQLQFDPTSIGSHSAQILASDGTVETLLPLSGVAVDSSTETDSFAVGPPSADVLFVVDVDDDGSEQMAIAQQAPTFFASAADIDFRIAVTTDNDYRNGPTADLGKLLPCPTCSMAGPSPIIISPSSVPAGGTWPDPTTTFADLLGAVPMDQYPTGVPADEHLFLALYSALQRGPQPGVDFFRPGAYFAAITDNGDNEPDESALGSGNHEPSWYATFFEAYFQRSFLFSWNYVNPTSTYTGTGFSDLLQLPPSIQEMISATGGLAVNSDDWHWAAAFASIWDLAQAASSYHTLVGSPSEGQGGIAVMVNGDVVPQLAGPGLSNWIYEPSLNAIVFSSRDPARIGSEIQVTYPIGCR